MSGSDCGWQMLAIKIEAGCTPKREDLEGMLRTGSGDIPQIVRNYIADALYKPGKGGRPPKPESQAETDRWRLAEIMVADIDRIRAGGLSLAKACKLLNQVRGSNASPESTERRYRRSLQALEHRRETLERRKKVETNHMFREAASLLGMTTTDFDKLRCFYSSL